jgi:Zn ribbon nucleic-acid-binding protein
MKTRLIWKPDDVEISLCINCNHKHADKGCDAFPNGIPLQIATNQHDHTKPFKGDNGITFESLTATAPESGKGKS